MFSSKILIFEDAPQCFKISKITEIYLPTCTKIPKNDVPNSPKIPKNDLRDSPEILRFIQTYPKNIQYLFEDIF